MSVVVVVVVVIVVVVVVGGGGGGGNLSGLLNNALSAVSPVWIPKEQLVM